MLKTQFKISILKKLNIIKVKSKSEFKNKILLLKINRKLK